MWFIKIRSRTSILELNSELRKINEIEKEVEYIYRGNISGVILKEKAE